MSIPYYDTQDDISIAGRKGGSAFIPIVNGRDFPLRPLNPRKLKIGLLTAAIKKAGLTEEEFLALL